MHSLPCIAFTNMPPGASFGRQWLRCESCSAGCAGWRLQCWLQHRRSMPIAVRVVNDRDYAAWLDQAKKKFATDDSRPARNIVAAK